MKRSVPNHLRLADIDLHVARRVRERRLALGIAQQELAAQIGLPGRWLCDAEKGKRRIRVGRLWDLAKALDVPVAWFFEDFWGCPHAPKVNGLRLLELHRNFSTVPPALQQAIVNMSAALAAESSKE
jgi:transcriptional regulator with XRE-family HTH domain